MLVLIVPRIIIVFAKQCFDDNEDYEGYGKYCFHFGVISLQIYNNFRSILILQPLFLSTVAVPVGY